MTTRQPGIGQRIGSWAVDWGMTAGWLGVLTVAGVAARKAGVEPTWSDQPDARAVLIGDVAITTAAVLPYFAYLSATEITRQATLGKQAAGLTVTDAAGERAEPSRILVRNAVKALPWKLSHLGVSRFILQVQTPVGIACSTAGTLLALACAVPALAGRRGLHDVIAGTRVIRSR